MLLSELIDRDVVIEWPEAVAVVRAVLEQVNGSRFPEAAYVELLASGQVKVHSAAPVLDVIGSAGELLQILMSRSDPPVQLRLLNSQAHDSIAEYFEALGFFERPNRAAVLIDLYARAAAATAIRGSTLEPADMGVFPSEAEKPANERARRPSIPSRTVVLATCFCAMLVIMVLGAKLANGTAEADAIPELPSKAASQTSEAPATGPASNRVVSAISSAVSAIENRLGLSGAAAESPAAKKPATHPGLEPKVHAAATEKRTAKPDVMRPHTERTDPARPVRTPATVQVPPPLALSEPPVVSNAVVTLVADSTVYTSRSADVVAAEGRRPQLPSITPETAGAARAKLRGIELLIRPDGSVESVKLVGAPRDVHDSMLLSAAKAWQFYPATKDGVPVRYRKTVWIPREMWGQD